MSRELEHVGEKLSREQDGGGGSLTEAKKMAQKTTTQGIITESHKRKGGG